jgi:hypothetical protein
METKLKVSDRIVSNDHPEWGTWTVTAIDYFGVTIRGNSGSIVIGDDRFWTATSATN